MKQHQSIFPVFFFCFLLVLLLIALSHSALFTLFRALIQKAGVPLQKTVYQTVHPPQKAITPQEKINLENQKLIKQFVDQKNLQKENNALRDQFQLSFPKSSTLLPSHVVGIPSFLPGVTLPETLIIDVGAIDHVKENDEVVFQNNLIGKIVQVSPELSKVQFVTDSGVSILAKTQPLDTNQKEALGIVKGMGGPEMLLDNVVLSETIKEGDIVLTKGTIDEKGHILPPDLIIGKITAVNKKESSLFQTAAVESFVDVTGIPIVFVITNAR